MEVRIRVRYGRKEGEKLGRGKRGDKLTKEGLLVKSSNYN
jgi:hypothetical protein